MDPPLVSVRDLEARDEAVWRRLWAGYLAFYAAIVASDVTTQTWCRLLDPTHPMFGRVAMVDGTVIGFTVCIVHDGTWSLRPTCYLEDFFVDPAARGAGIGRALLDDLIKLGETRKWSSIYWHTRKDNAQARRLYDRYLLADKFVRYRLTIEDNRPNHQSDLCT